MNDSIIIDSITCTYSGAQKPALKNVNAEIKCGELVLLCGASGSGKTTFTRLINGLIPHYYECELSGKVTVFGRDVINDKLYKTAEHTASVFQNPKTQFYTLTVDDEIVFGMENLAVPIEDMHLRRKLAMDNIGIGYLSGRNIFTLSGGEMQKVACASADALLPEVIVLDEPTSNLDTDSMKDLARIIEKWKTDGRTVIISEHRLDWIKGFADKVILFDDSQIRITFTGKEFNSMSPDELHSLGLRGMDSFTPKYKANGEIYSLGDICFSYKRKTKPVLDIRDLQLRKGSVTAVIGRNGAGKSTLARVLCVLERKCKVKSAGPGFMVFQDVDHQLFTPSVAEELLCGNKKFSKGSEAQREEIRKRALAVLEQLGLTEYKNAHPMSLSGGQKQRTAIACALLSERKLLIYDEPTSGLDYGNMLAVSQLIRSLSDGEVTQLVITHDPEFIENCCDSFILLDNGCVTSSGSFCDEENIGKVRSFFFGGA
jgi:energy-coupling factor transport system ATP-binding protein